jgi:hypothetical protein
MSLLDDLGLIQLAHHWLTQHGVQPMVPGYGEGRFELNNCHTGIYNEHGTLVCAATPRGVLVMVAFALGFDAKNMGRLFKRHAVKIDDYLNIKFQKTEFTLYGTNIHKTDLGIFFIKTLSENPTNYRFTQILDKKGTPIVELGLLHTDVRRYWLGTRIDSPLQGDKSDEYGRVIPSAITRIHHLPGASYYTLLERMGAFTDLVLKHKNERVGQWEEMLIELFEEPRSAELRQAFIDVASGEHSQQFLLGLSSVMGRNSSAKHWLRRAIDRACEIAGPDSPVTRSLTSCVVQANMAEKDRSVEFGQALIKELLAYDLSDIGYAQLNSLDEVPMAAFSADVELTTRLLVKLVSAFQLMIDGVLAGHQKDDRHAYLTENVMAILGGDLADALFAEAIQKIPKIITPLPELVGALGQKEQDTLVLLGYDLKGLTKTSRRVKGQRLMDSLGL